MESGYGMLRGTKARGFMRTAAGETRLRAEGLTPRIRCALYAADTAERLCVGAADARGGLDIAYRARAGGVCLLADGRPALWTEGCDAVALSLYVARETQKRSTKRYRLNASRRFPRKETPARETRKKPAKRYRLNTSRRFPRKETPARETQKKPGVRLRILPCRRFRRARSLRAPSDAPALGALPTLDWGGAAKWKPYFDLLMPCAPVSDRAWRFVRAPAAGGGECYLGMRTARDAVAEIIALPVDSTSRFTLYRTDN